MERIRDQSAFRFVRGHCAHTRNRHQVGDQEPAQLGRTLWRRRADVLAYFDHHASDGPTEAINGRLEALRRNALGFRNLTHYRLRSLHAAAALCAKITINMSHQQWRDWVSPDIDYIEACPGLPIPADG